MVPNYGKYAALNGMNARLPPNTLQQFIARSDALEALLEEFEQMLWALSARSDAAGIRERKFYPTDDLLNLTHAISEEFNTLTQDINDANGWARAFGYLMRIEDAKPFNLFGYVMDNLRDVLRFLLKDLGLYNAYPPLPPLADDEAAVAAEAPDAAEERE
jgi:hypothetical protein